MSHKLRVISIKLCIYAMCEISTYRQQKVSKIESIIRRFFASKKRLKDGLCHNFRLCIIWVNIGIFQKVEAQYVIFSALYYLTVLFACVLRLI